MARVLPTAKAFRCWGDIAIISLLAACTDAPPVSTPTDAGFDVDWGDVPLAERIITPNRSDTLGRVCTTDEDCPLLQCVKPTDKSMGGGGPAHGYCSIPCTAADDPFCMAADGKCLDFAPSGAPSQPWCVQTCRRGGGGGDGAAVFHMNKCRGRTDVACTPSSVSGGQPSVEGYCLPTCNGDAECAGRRCDPSSGVCLDSVSGDPTGTACAVRGSAEAGADGDTDATADEAGDGEIPNVVRSTDCAGVCLAVGVSTHVCAQRCTYGSTTACHMPEGPIDGGVGDYSACIFVATNGSTGPGDEAHCGQLCDSDADCFDHVDPGVVCNQSAEALKAFGHGYCDWTLSPSDGGSADR